MDTAFLGRGWAFPPRFDTGKKGLVLSDGVEDIEESLRILLQTQPGERVMQAGYGCDLRRYMFEILDRSTLTLIRNEVSRAVLFYEPRIVLDKVSAVPDPDIQGALRLHLAYTVRTTNARHNMVYPLYLQQATNALEGS